MLQRVGGQDRFKKKYCDIMKKIIIANRECSEIINSLPKKKKERQYALYQSIVLFKADEYAHQLTKLAPYTSNQQMIDRKTSVYICKGNSCHAPVTDFQTIESSIIC
jgi:hypothetical protein